MEDKSKSVQRILKRKSVTPRQLTQASLVMGERSNCERARLLLKRLAAMGFGKRVKPPGKQKRSIEFKPFPIAQLPGHLKVVAVGKGKSSASA